MADDQRFWIYYNASMRWKDKLLDIEASSNTVNEPYDLNDQTDADEKNEEFLNFIIETRKHQLERDRRRREETIKESNEVEYRDITDLEIRANFRNLKEPELRKDLYGDRSEEIYSKELKLQFNFNEFCDKNLPNYWPLIPINLKI